jgi:hypothetical protein
VDQNPMGMRPAMPGMPGTGMNPALMPCHNQDMMMEMRMTLHMMHQMMAQMDRRCQEMHEMMKEMHCKMMEQHRRH